MFDRKNAFSIKIEDSDNPNGNYDINSFVVVGNDLFFFTESKIYRALTASTIDPTNKHPNTRHSYEKKYDIGSASPFVARVIIQFADIINFLYIPENEIKDLLSFIWNANQYLLNSFLIDTSIVKETTKLLPLCDKIIENHKNSSSIPALPQISNFEENVRVYLSNAKLFLIECFRLLNIFYKMPFNTRKAANFTTHLEWLEKKLGKDHRITQLISQDLDWIRLISECRNALEHSEKGQEVKFRNVSLLPGNKFSGPAWSCDLTKKLGFKFDFVDLINDLVTFSHNMLHFFEELFLVCVDEKLSKNNVLTLGKIPEENINTKCPVLYKVTLRKGFLNNK